ncbi:hypothetical protein, partial [Klebsiella pneumoniae]|uniref:hypothetical protein n=1 Tax=Klebsiella pneumoniae TaxID=573 RepID=UPI001953EC05
MCAKNPCFVVSVNDRFAVIFSGKTWLIRYRRELFRRFAWVFPASRLAAQCRWAASCVGSARDRLFDIVEQRDAGQLGEAGLG